MLELYMASFDDDVDPTAGSQEEDEDEDMDDVNEPDQDAEPDQDDNGDEEDEDNENDDDDDDDGDQDDVESPSRRVSQAQHISQDGNPSLVLTSPSPRASAGRSPGNSIVAEYIPPPRSEAVTAQAYDIVPTMAAPQSTSINAITATPDMRWVFSGGTDGYVRMYNWVDTANGKVPLTVAQKHPFVDSVMKAGSLLTYWENEDATLRTPTQADDGKWLSPVYSLAVEHQAIWLLSGTESGGINLQTCRHQAGTRITTLKEHTSAVSVLALASDQCSVLSGSWDKNIHDWDLQTGKVKRSFRDSGGQIGAIEVRPFSESPVPEVAPPVQDIKADTFSSNNAAAPQLNGFQNDDLGGEEDAAGSPENSLFGDGSHGSLFGDDNEPTNGSTNVFADDDFTQALRTETEGEEQDAAAQNNVEMTGMGDGGPVQPPDLAVKTDLADYDTAEDKPTADASDDHDPSGQPHSDEPLTAPPTDEGEKHASTTELPPQSESVFLDAAIDGVLRIWDKRVSSPIATILPHGSTPPWCTGACWSPDGNFFYAGRRGCTVDEYSIHHLGSKQSSPNRIFRFQNGSGPVYAVRAMPNKRHLICASNDILRLYDLSATDTTRHRTVPFTIVPGHRGGVISSIYIDPTCRFMLSAAGNRGWEGSSTEVLLGYEIGVQDVSGVWHK
ncbi:hypothetical protein AMS68_000730 [Peltaster fructicola]|uniref:Mitochondrial division protein 1 n=1 Tax=Peltaster fructicola TaxID=286661 RepID=A0A6H0XKG3_9PEZI|nr:hypothetical protein AMS68_000730 [Peltaster fructicola]